MNHPACKTISEQRRTMLFLAVLLLLSLNHRATAASIRGSGRYLLKKTVASGDVGALIDDVDGDGNECFVDGDNYEEDPGNTDRGDWGKCIPPPAYGVLGASENQSRKPATRKLYRQLRDLHNKYCTHLDISISEDADEAIEAYLLGKDPFKNRVTNRAFQKEFQRAMGAAVKISMTYGQTRPNAPFDGECNDEYTIVEFELDYVDGEFEITEIILEAEEDGRQYEADAFEMCGTRPDGSDVGMACVWTLDDPDAVLPEDQAANFDNTDFIDGLEFPVPRSLVDDEAADFEILFSKRAADDDVHCHYSPSADGFLRVHNYQHDLERKYPGQIKQVCFCDWKSVAKVVTQCDCTLNGSANNGCGDEEAEAAEEAGFTCNNC